MGQVRRRRGEIVFGVVQPMPDGSMRNLLPAEMEQEFVDGLARLRPDLFQWTEYCTDDGLRGEGAGDGSEG